ncbi:MAG: hypothetical protein EXR76_03870 [Myxococcales bacterium]|nr:hypothetical protein [Myxococcales bacterium]
MRTRFDGSVLRLALLAAALTACADEVKKPANPFGDIDVGLDGPPATCSADFNCADGKVCVAGVCLPGQCNEDRTCPAGQMCNRANYSCSGDDPMESPCGDDDDCAMGTHCLANRCQNVACVTDAHCDPGEECTAQNRCVPMVNECVDADGDGYGLGCASGADCDDAREDVNSGAMEDGSTLCDDGVDNDCEGGDSICGETDTDMDGVTNKAGDCDDTDAAVNPNAMETPYNGKDDDCDEDTRDADVDGDGFEAMMVGGMDCNDRAPHINPEARDIPGNGIDEDCDGTDRMPSGEDADMDGVTEANGDCNDMNMNVLPGAPEVPYNGLDDDCDAATSDSDVDVDGFAHPQDCDDSNAMVNPNAMETPYNGLDDDCDPATSDGDADGDGFPGGQNGTDCNDGAADVNPDATEVAYNMADDDCDPATADDDLDADGVLRADDCDDNDATISPMIVENFDMNCGDGVDHDCRGGDVACDAGVVDTDGDGVADADDCAPQDPSIPAGREIPNNGVDDDCDPNTPDGCDDDAFEDAASNGDARGATGVDDGNTTGVQYGNLTICPNDEDWYEIDVRAGDGLEVDLAFVHGDGDIDVTLQKLDANGAIVYVDGSVGVTDTETVYERRAAVDTTYYVRVYGFDDRRNGYSMTVNVFTQCTDDLEGAGREHNDGRGFSTSMPDAATGPRQICDHDEDWYTFDVGARENVRIDLLFADARGDIDLELYRDGDAAALSRSVGVDDNEVIEAMLERGTYSVRVFGFGNAVNRYRLFATSGQTDSLIERMPAADVRIPDAVAGVPGIATTDLAFDAPAGSIIRSLTIRDLDINHDWLRDLVVVAQWDDQDIATLWNREGTVDGKDGGLDDDFLPFTGGDINFDNRIYQQFVGLNADGIFTLVVRDEVGMDTGSIADLEVEIVYLVP